MTQAQKRRDFDEAQRGRSLTTRAQQAVDLVAAYITESKRLQADIVDANEKTEIATERAAFITAVQTELAK